MANGVTLMLKALKFKVYTSFTLAKPKKHIIFKLEKNYIFNEENIYY